MQYPAACVLTEGPAEEGERLRIAIDGPQDGVSLMSMPQAQVLARSGFNSYLVIRDCEGRLFPGAALRWEKLANGKRWKFLLRDTLYGLDGSPLTASGISRHLDVTSLDQVERLEALSDIELVIEFVSPQDELPLALFSPAFELPVTDSAELIYMDEEDGRNMLESGVHGLLTRDPDVIDYAARRPEWTIIQLDWGLAYQLAVPVGGLKGDDEQYLPAYFLDLLARDTVPVEARGAIAEYGWQHALGCSFDVPSGEQMQENLSKQIRYAADDPVGKALAERLAVLAGTQIAEGEALRALLVNPGTGWVARGAQTPMQLARGELLVFPLQRTSPDVCGQMNAALAQIPWLLNADGEFNYTFVPLVDIRSTLILEKGRVSVAKDEFGRVYLSPAQLP